jgi:hypothetical protein
VRPLPSSNGWIQLIHHSEGGDVERVAFAPDRCEIAEEAPHQSGQLHDRGAAEHDGAFVHDMEIEIAIAPGFGDEEPHAGFVQQQQVRFVPQRKLIATEGMDGRDKHGHDGFCDLEDRIRDRTVTSK